MAHKAPEAIVRLNIVERFIVKHLQSGAEGRDRRKTRPREAPQKPEAPPAVCLTDGTAWVGDPED